MTTGLAGGASRDRLGVWCGWVLIAVCAATPLFAWLAPKGFAALVALGGLLTLPAIRIEDDDRPGLIVLFAALIWAAVSTIWSPFHPSRPDNNTILKLAAQLPLYWSLISGARRADPRLQRLALAVLAWGLTAFAVILIAETITGGALYQHLRNVAYAPMRQDIAEAKLGHATFVMTALLPLVVLGGPRRLRPGMGLVMVVGAGSAALAFGSDAPVIALVVAPLVALAVWRWPSVAPKLIAVAAAALWLGAPAVVWAVRHFTDYAALQRAVPQSYAMRLGYWSHAIDWIRLHPLRGWGLDASRMFAPGIDLHPHNGSLQVWLELGGVGAIAAAAFWAVTLLRLSRPRGDLAVAAAAACAAVYLVFGFINFGIWQDWWVALGALIVVLAGLHQPSTSPRLSE
ncbi:O-antigen ligase family protein [Phenylobacterium sp.]|uniref:O-antigen ligase family protein n=1 Tax=Phenylobacterium sp. TaxID=1871053 RepID=UPI0035686580